MFQWFDVLQEKAYPLSPCCYETQSGEGGGTGAPSAPAPSREPGLWSRDKIATSSASIAALATPATPAPAPFVPNYQMFTPEQLAQSGIDLTAWFEQNRALFDPNNTMGDLSQALAGSPIATGYIDENGQFVGTPFAGAGQAHQLRQLAQTGPQITDISQSQPYQGLSDLLGQMRNTQPMTAEQRAAYGEQMLGYSPGSLAEFTGQLKAGVGAQEGLSAEEESLYNRNIQNQIDAMRKENREIMGALAGSGRSIAAFDAMEAAGSQIADFTIQSKLALIENDLARKKLEYQAIMDQASMIQKAGEGSYQYEQNLNTQWNTMMQGYATQITGLAQENAQYLQQFESHADALYRSMISDLGLSEAAMNQSAELWAQAHMDELLAQSEEIIAELLKG